MWNYALLAVAAALLAGLLWSERKPIARRVLAFKTPLSCLFVLAALWQPHPDAPYYHLVLIGLILGLIGDVCLAMKGDAPFRIGLFSFLAGHLLYAAAFAGLARASDWLSPAQLVFPAVSLAVFFWLRPHLGKMLAPVIAYLAVITVMTAAAWAAFQGRAAGAGGGLLLIGAVCFYLSDVLVARDRFMAPGFVNRLLGLPLYYVGQFLIAFSVGMIGMPG
jgi:uncharacterized membrane protein YhhN